MACGYHVVVCNNVPEPTPTNHPEEYVYKAAVDAPISPYIILCVNNDNTNNNMIIV